ncbi:MAG: enoyl-CoA hydratase family protein [Candidatus Krumholzibacteria bacterium]|nr:enoyl-CoA hydratase family protein [Candidatus Krumholzibacteria bacterium]MDH4336410.1 enoyl-CoA hydratase family protein [Candidatus Krumholzibacteria bacterium]MDH5269535.1 enoyl-CoA hydratase family protein [Candidatus Krumholzibacteria bacterium]
MDPASFQPQHFAWEFDNGVATVTLNRPERRNALTFESYAELRDTFRALRDADTVRAVVVRGAGGNFCSGGDVHEIIGPLVAMPPRELAAFTRMTGDLVIAMLTCRQIIVAAIDGVCVGAGAAIAMASDIRFGTPQSRVGFLFVRVGLAGCDMGACAMLPRIIGHGRAAELLYTGRMMDGAEAHANGFFNRLPAADALAAEAAAFAREIADGPMMAHRVTKRMLLEEWAMDVVPAVVAEAREQALLMQSKDFRRAYEAFTRKEAPRFEGD